MNNGHCKRAGAERAASSSPFAVGPGHLRGHASFLMTSSGAQLKAPDARWADARRSSTGGAKALSDRRPARGSERSLGDDAATTFGLTRLMTRGSRSVARDGIVAACSPTACTAPSWLGPRVTVTIGTCANIRARISGGEHRNTTARRSRSAPHVAVRESDTRSARDGAEEGDEDARYGTETEPVVEPSPEV